MTKLLTACTLATLAVSVCVGAAGASGAGPGWLKVTSSSRSVPGGKIARLTATTGGAIPTTPSGWVSRQLVAGLAWVDAKTGKAFVATIHPQIGSDSFAPGQTWHGHTVSLAGGATAPNDFCLASIDSSPVAEIAVARNQMTVFVYASDLPEQSAKLTTSVGFTLQKDTACAKTSLAVRVAK